MNIFNKFDPNNDLKISFDEAIFMAKAFELTHNELILLFNEIDSNGDG